LYVTFLKLTAHSTKHNIWRQWIKQQAESECGASTSCGLSGIFSSAIIPHSNKFCSNITINRSKEHKHHQTEHSKLHYKQARNPDFWLPKEDRKDKQQVYLFT
jgi:hypothetical protein